MIIIRINLIRKIMRKKRKLILIQGISIKDYEELLMMKMILKDQLMIKMKSLASLNLMFIMKIMMNK